MTATIAWRDILDELAAKGVRAETIIKISKLIEAVERQMAYRERERLRLQAVRVRTRTDAYGKTSTKSNDANAFVRVQGGLLSSSLLPLLNSTSLEKEERSESVALGGADFAAFWLRYPNKVGKRAAQKAFAAARKRAPMAEIMAGLARYAAKADDRPWCNPATWLNQDRWADQPGPSQQGNGGVHGRRAGSLLDVIDRVAEHLGDGSNYVPGSEGPRPLGVGQPTGARGIRSLPKG